MRKKNGGLSESLYIVSRRWPRFSGVPFPDGK